MKKFFCLLTVLALSFYAHSKSKGEWNKMMASFIQPLRTLYSVDLDKKVFTADEVKVLSKTIDSFKASTHNMRIAFVSFFSSKDPAVKAKYKEFLRNLDHADKSVESSPTKAVYYLKNAVVQCASCHSDGGKSTEFFDLFEKVKMGPYDKGRLALALRDFGASAAVYKKMMLSSSDPENVFTFNRSLINYLNSKVLGSSDKAEILKDLAQIRANLKNDFLIKKIDQQIQDVESFKPINSVEKAIYVYKKVSKELDRNKEKIYTTLAVKNHLHSNLKEIEKKHLLAEVYKTLGDIYSDFAELSVFMVPERNYEFCVKTLPKSELAKECFERYTNSVVLGYSGSAGMNIPQFEKDRIKKLKKLID